MIEIDDLTVRFGGVTPLDHMTINFETGTCGLIGPNGAGKTTFFNVLSGFVNPPRAACTAFGEDLLAMAHYRRARWGVRRTFQTEQAIEELSIYDNVAMVRRALEAQDARRAPRRRARRRSSSWARRSNPQTKVGTLGARERRLVELARAVVGKPRVVLLDEPAAGLPDEETEHLGAA